ncbi:MAG: hypothetical protein HW375_1250 [Anaerolineales bacterium]|nr:hypothetical protein [Anaerolineales bacterium]
MLPGAYGTIRTMSSRLLRFLIGLALGVVLGLGYAWRIQPVAGEGDLRLALLRLAALGPQPPADIVEDAAGYAEANGFGQVDRAALRQLADDLRSIPSSPEIGGS